MDIEHLREFLTLADAVSLSEAADRLFLSQSTVSRHLQQLEAELGTPLFYRTSRRLEINASGRLLLPYARELVDQYDACRRAMAAQLRQARGQLVIGSLPAMTEYPIRAMIESFGAAHPDEPVRVVEGESYELKEQVLAGECDAAFVREAGGEDGRFVRVPLCTDRLVAVLPRTHPLAGQTSVQLRQLREETFLTLPRDTVMYDVTLDLCRAAGFTPDIAMQSHHMRTAIDLLSRQAGVSIASERTARVNAGAQTALVPIEPEARTQINVICRRGDAERPNVRAFLQAVREFRQTDEAEK